MTHDQLLTFDIQRSLPWLYLGLGFAQAAHSIEEVLTGLWRWMPIVSGVFHAQTGFIPTVVMSERTFIIGNMIIIALMLGFSPLLFLNRTWAWSIATVVAVIQTMNGAGHISMAFAHHGYFPGCISGVALILFSVPIWARRWIWCKEIK